MAVSRSGSSAASLLTATTGSTSSGVSTRGSSVRVGLGVSLGLGASAGGDEVVDGGEQLGAAERAALVPAPLRRAKQRAADMTVLTGREPFVVRGGGGGGDEDVVSPLSTGSPGVRFWDVGAALSSAGSGGGAGGAGFTGLRRESDDDILERMGLVSPIISPDGNK